MSPPLPDMSPETSQSPSEPSPTAAGNGNGNGTAARPAKRARTDAQMAQKRKADRLKHRVNRAESKTRLENIERDVSFLRSSVGDLLSQLRIVRRADPAAVGAAGDGVPGAAAPSDAAGVGAGAGAPPAGMSSMSDVRSSTLHQEEKPWSPRSWSPRSWSSSSWSPRSRSSL